MLSITRAAVDMGDVSAKTNFAIGDNQSPTAMGAIEFTNGTPPNGTYGYVYNFQFTTDGTDPVSFSTSDTLPQGITLSSEGVLTGTPTEVGSFPITVTASNGGTV